MPFNPFTSVTGKNSFTLFEIRLENDFIVFRGNEHESSGQLLKGTVVLCLPAPLKIEDVHLRLLGTLHLGWMDSKVTPTGISTQRVDKTSLIYNYKWQPFVGVGASDSSTSLSTISTKGVTLPAGNYEWPFELLLPGEMIESVEGMHEASITYRLKATVARGKLACDLHAYKRLRVVRTLDSSALEFLHAMSVENIWPNKVEYSVVIPQKAVVFGTAISLVMRFTPLLKGLDVGYVTVRLTEVHEILLQPQHGGHPKEHKREQQIAVWTLPMSKEEHWHDMIEDTGQEGWIMQASLDLPRKLGKCMQDVSVFGIKIRHKLKLVVMLKNPDGHISELRATLPVTIFISPNMPLDDEGNLMPSAPSHGANTPAVNAIAPPGYGDHMLDQLYEDVSTTGFHTPAVPSEMNSPFYGHSRAGSAENLAAMMHSTAVPPAALSSRLQSVSLDSSHRNTSATSMQSLSGPASGPVTPSHPGDSAPQSASFSPPHFGLHSNTFSVQVSDEREQSSGTRTPEHVDVLEMSSLSKVPSYKTAIKSPVRPLNYDPGLSLPDYRTATSVPSSPTHLESATTSEHLTTIAEGLESDVRGSVREQARTRESSPVDGRPSMGRKRQTTLGFSFHNHHDNDSGERDDRRRSHFVQAARERLL